MNAQLLFSAGTAGITSLIEYISAHVITCLLPAFFIAGAMSALIPKEKIIRHLGKDAPKHIAYLLAVAAGLLLAVCSCTILPLFAGIKKKGAGIGPALAFLYTAPATNILAITLTGSVLGWDFALSRIILSVIFAVLTGIIVSAAFKEENNGDVHSENILHPKQEKKHGSLLGFLKCYKLLIFFSTLFSILIVGTRVPPPLKYYILFVLVILLVLITRAFFSAEEIKEWLSETWMFFYKIFPLLLAGIFAAGTLTSLIPQNYLAEYVGRNTPFANLAAALFGLFMYFPTLVEVPMAKMFLSLGMAKGPLLTYLLADPVVSLPSLLVVAKLIGKKRTLLYAALIIIFTTASGLIYGYLRTS